MSLENKENESLKIIGRAFSTFTSGLATTFTGGKDSLVVLHLVKRFCDGIVPIPVINIDTFIKFPEIYTFRDFIAREWKLDLRIASDREAASRISIAADKGECCKLLKIDVLIRVIKDNNLQASMTGVRKEEQETRATESHFSKKDNPPHTRVNPVLNFTEDDIWEYIDIYALPYCTLYNE